MNGLFKHLHEWGLSISIWRTQNYLHRDSATHFRYGYIKKCSIENHNNERSVLHAILFFKLNTKTILKSDI